MRRRTSSIGLLAALLIAACGSSSGVHSHSSSSGQPIVPSSSSSSSFTSASSSGSSTPRTTSGASTTSATNAAGSPSASNTTPASRAGNLDVRVPATFTIGSDGSLTPPVIAVPKNIDIELTLVSRDGHPQQLTLKTPEPYTLTVPARSRTVRLLRSVRPGTYQIDLGHGVSGRLIVGVAPGP